MGSVDIGEHSLCMVLPHLYTLNTRLEIVDTVLTLLIPSVTISALNIRIIYAVFKIHRDRRTMNTTHNHRHHSSNGELNVNGVRLPAGMMGTATPLPSTPSRYTHLNMMSVASSQHSRHTLNARRKHHNSQVKVTKMLVLVSSTFLVLNLPSHALRLYAFASSILTEQIAPPTKRYMLIQRLFQYLNYTNFAINFFLYNTCGRNFRHALRHLGRKIKYNLHHKWNKFLGRKPSEDDIAVVMPVKRKPVPVEEDIHPLSGQHNMSMHRGQSSQSGASKSGVKGSKGSKSSRGSKVELRASAVQMRSHHSHNSCHSYHSRGGGCGELSHHSREFSHHSRAEFSHHARSDFSHHSRFVSGSCSDVSTSSCSHRSLHRCKCKPL